MNSTIGAIYCITLECRPEKKKFMEEQAKKYNLPIIFYIAKLHPICPKQGCKESHLEIIKLAKSKCLPNVLILEDDALFLQSPDTLPPFPKPFDMLYLGGNVQQVFDDPLNRSSHWKRVSSFTTHAYIIHHTIYNKVINDLPKWTKEIDVYYSDIIHRQYKSYILYPMICIQKPGYSDIEKKVVNYQPFINNRKIELYLLQQDISHKSSTLFMDMIFVINLQRRHDRRNNMTKLLHDNSLIAKFWDAVDSENFEITPEIQDMFCNNNFESDRSIMACALSHTELWRYLSNSKVYSKIMIFEDDIELCNDFSEQWKCCYQQVIQIDPDWEIIYLGGDSQNKQPNGQKLTKNITKPHQKYFMGAYSYCITKKFAQKMLSLIKTYQLTRPIDLYMIESFHNIRAYTVFPFLINSFVTSDSNVKRVN